MENFDLVVIGSGPAGEKAAVKAAYFGKRVAIVECQTGFGGAVVHTGTLPSKTLKETALYYSGKYDRGLYGQDRSTRAEATLDDFFYRQRLVSSVANDDVRSNLIRHGVRIFHGQASFQDHQTILVQGPQVHELRADFFVVATGSYPFHPPEIPFDGINIHDSDTILRLQKIPKSLCIVGAGVIGCEYATIFANMGTKVYLVNTSSEILGFLDREVARTLAQLMEKDGITLLFQNAVKSIQQHAASQGEPSSAYLHLSLQDGTTLDVEMFLYAAGRCGTTGQLGCAQAGIEIGKREAIIVNEHYQTANPRIYAVGDVIGFPALASTSMDQGRVAVSHMFQIGDLDSLPKLFCYGIYTIPEVSCVGLTEEDALRQGIAYGIGRAFHAKLPRGRILGAEEGFLKILFTPADGVIRGVHVIGHLAAELIHFGLCLVQDQKTLHDVVATVFNFPTLHELYKYACYDGLSDHYRTAPASSGPVIP